MLVKSGFKFYYWLTFVLMVTFKVFEETVAGAVSL